MYNLQIIEERIMSIAYKKGLSKNKLLINSKLNKSVFDNMKKGQIPSVDKIHIIADYLDCSVDYLLGRTDVIEVNKSTKPISIAEQFRSLNTSQVAAYGSGAQSQTIENPEEVSKAIEEFKKQNNTK